jgi:hypothetical protein
MLANVLHDLKAAPQSLVRQAGRSSFVVHRQVGGSGRLVRPQRIEARESWSAASRQHEKAYSRKRMSRFHRATPAAGGGPGADQ